YQQWNAFTSNVTSAGLAMPGGSHWATPLLYMFWPGYIVFGTYGAVAPMSWSDIIYVTLSSDGSSTARSTFSALTPDTPPPAPDRRLRAPRIEPRGAAGPAARVR